VQAKRLLNSVNPLSYFRTAQQIKKFKPDLVIVSYWMTFFIPAYAVILKLLGKKVKTINLFHNVISHEPKFFDKLLTKFFIKQSTASLVLSEAVKEDLLSLNPRVKYLCSPHPLYNHFGSAEDKLQAQRKLGLSMSRKTLLFFGLIRDYKGLDLLIEAFGKLSSEYQLLIAGEPYGSFEKYEKQIAALPNAQDVHAEARYIKDDEVPLFFSAADVCILPYRSATQSGITSIAYHFNLPMIATNVGGLQESISDGENGVIVAPTADGIVEGIRRFFAEGSREKFAANIAQLKKDLSWETLAKSIVEFSKTL
jgi:glycosyltransferase involved in cell wall biosynthesis